MTDQTVTLTEQAAEVIEAMRVRVAHIGAIFGGDSPEYTAAARSLGEMLTKVLTMTRGGARVMRDGELSLLVDTASGFSYGIVFFRDHGAAERHLRRHGHTPESSPDWQDMLDQHADIAGTWSAHS
jgi:hypothetical protein